MPRPHQSQVRLSLFDPGVDRPWHQPTIAGVIELYLDESRRRAALDLFDPARLAEHERLLASFAAHCGGKEIRDAGNRDLTAWLAANPKWGTGSALSAAVDAVIACFRWAADPGVREIQSSPFTAESETARPTVKYVLDWFTEHDPGQPESPEADTERKRIRKLFAAAHGHRLVDECSPRLVTEFIDKQKFGSNWTRKRWNAAIQKPFNHARKKKLIGTNPFEGVSYPEGGKGRDWTDEEFRAMLRSSTAVYRRFLVMERFSGCRPGEGRVLEWPDIIRSLDRAVLARAKTKTKNERIIETNHVTLKLLLWLLKRRPGNETHVFLNSFGRPWSKNALTKRLRAIRVKAGLPKDLKLNGGRHTFATQSLLSGTVTMAELAELLGHKRTSTTENHYKHLSEKRGHLHEAAERAIRRRQKPGEGPSGKVV